MAASNNCTFREGISCNVGSRELEGTIEVSSTSRVYYKKHTMKRQKINLDTPLVSGMDMFTSKE